MTAKEKIDAMGVAVTSMSEAEVARTAGVSRERVRQIVPLLRYKPTNHIRDAVYVNFHDFYMAMKPDVFNAYVDERGPDECWPWTGSVNPVTGYGQMSKGRNSVVAAHRLAYERAFGPIPKGMFVCHKCDNPPCCNPSHLFAGTAADNVHDCMRKGRWGVIPFGKSYENQCIVNLLSIVPTVGCRRPRNTYRTIASLIGTSITRVAQAAHYHKTRVEYRLVVS